MIKILSLEKALGPLTPGVFLFRENRFTAYVKVSNSVFKAHVSDTGRLKELLIEGREVLLSANPNGKLDFKLVAVKHEGEWVLVNTALHSKIAERLLKLGVLGFIPKSLKKEVVFGKSRMDFFLNGNVVVEVKGCNLEKDGVCLFPDAPTERGTKHLEELVRLKLEGFESYLLFLLLRKCSSFSPNTKTDKKFSNKFYEAISKGVKVIFAPLKIENFSVYFLEEKRVNLKLTE